MKKENWKCLEMSQGLILEMNPEGKFIALEKKENLGEGLVMAWKPVKGTPFRKRSLDGRGQTEVAIGTFTELHRRTAQP